MLQTALGLDAVRIAGAFLVSPKTMGQRLVRAKTKIRDGGIGFEVPESMMTILSCLCKKLTLASSRGPRPPMGAKLRFPVVTRHLKMHVSEFRSDHGQSGD
jgi:hypothetical protein